MRPSLHWRSSPLRRIAGWHSGAAGQEARIEYSAGAEAREPSAELRLGPAQTPPRLVCDPPIESAPPPARAAGEEPPEPVLEAVTTSLGPAELCVAGEVGELRVTVGGTAAVFSARFPPDELVALAAALRPVEGGD